MHVAHEVPVILALLRIQIFPNRVLRYSYTSTVVVSTGVCCRRGRNTAGTPTSWHTLPWWAGNEILLTLFGAFLDS